MHHLTAISAKPRQNLAFYTGPPGMGLVKKTGILFEIATGCPGFATDEPIETPGEKLSLPPLLEPRRAQIEAGLKPLG